MLQEIGLRRVVKYLIFGLWDAVFRLLPWSPLRIIWLKAAGARIPWTAVVDRVNFVNLDRTGLRGLSVGEKSFIGCAAIIDLAGSVNLGDHVTISPGAVILSHLSVGFSDHPLITAYPKKVETTSILDGSFVGAQASILSGIRVGARSMVAAGSVVTKDVPAGTLVAGVPAVVKKKLTN